MDDSDGSESDEEATNENQIASLDDGEHDCVGKDESPSVNEEMEADDVNNEGLDKVKERRFKQRQSRRSPSILKRFESLLQKWNEMESPAGVTRKETSAPSYTTRSCTKNVHNREQEQKDSKMMQRCHSWREVYKALLARQEEMVKGTRRGSSKRRKLGEDLDVRNKG